MIIVGGYKVPLIYVDSTKVYAQEEVPQVVKDYLKRHKDARIVFSTRVSDRAKSEIKRLLE